MVPASTWLQNAGDGLTGSLLIIGASGRAAAASAIRAGLRPFVIDLFADADTRRLCDVLQCPLADYSQGFVELAKQAPPGPWMYTGGLENYPDVVAAISTNRQLWGNGPDQLATVRDPFRLSHLLGVNGLAHPEVRPTPKGLPSNQRWLRKPLAGSGGFGISEANHKDQPSVAHYYQQFVPGRSMSALAFDQQTFGITEQLIGTSWLHAPLFRYAGNLGPFPIGKLDCNDVTQTAVRIGERLRLRGVYGIDFVHDGDWANIIEVNPRYPASSELYELAWGIEVLDWHRSAYWKSPRKPKAASVPNLVVGKGIYYAAKTITFPATGPWMVSLANCTDVWRIHDFADIPQPGTIIDAGQPVLTLFASAPSQELCLQKMKQTAAGLDLLLGVPTPR